MVQAAKARQFSETLTLSSNTQSTALESRYGERLVYQLTWSGLTGLSSTVIPQVSNDGTNWTDLESVYNDVIYTLDAASGTQNWWFREIPARYVRMSYVANGNTTGTATLLSELERTD